MAASSARALARIVASSQRLRTRGGVVGAPPRPVARERVRSDKTAREHANALEWTRTTTGKTPHKALNLIHPALMGPATSRSSSLRSSQDASDVSGGATFVRVLSRAAEGPGRSRVCGPAPVERVGSAPVPARAVSRKDVAAHSGDASAFRPERACGGLEPARSHWDRSDRREAVGSALLLWRGQLRSCRGPEPAGG
jgi:hypothetical protein